MDTQLKEERETTEKLRRERDELSMLNATLMEEAESYELLLQERTMNGTFLESSAVMHAHDNDDRNMVDKSSSPIKYHGELATAAEADWSPSRLFASADNSFSGNSLASELQEAATLTAEDHAKVEAELRKLNADLHSEIKALTLFISKILKKLEDADDRDLQLQLNRSTPRTETSPTKRLWGFRRSVTGTPIPDVTANTDQQSANSPRQQASSLQVALEDGSKKYRADRSRTETPPSRQLGNRRGNNLDDDELRAANRLSTTSSMGQSDQTSPAYSPVFDNDNRSAPSNGILSSIVKRFSSVGGWLGTQPNSGPTNGESGIDGNNTMTAPSNATETTFTAPSSDGVGSPAATINGPGGVDRRYSFQDSSKRYDRNRETIHSDGQIRLSDDFDEDESLAVRAQSMLQLSRNHEREGNFDGYDNFDSNDNGVAGIEGSTKSKYSWAQSKSRKDAADRETRRKKGQNRSVVIFGAPDPDFNPTESENI
ncbi:hypothetical protein HDU76_005928 [Blyttiomyces sp. JEL0837]|nr:hypothetical protein HDU76_005928 [Blyttiomyces sp. JEL0837]